MRQCFSGAPKGRVLAFAFLFIAFLLPPLFADDQTKPADNARAPAQTETDKDKSEEQADVVITATRTETNSLLTPYFVTTITNADILASVSENISQIVGAKAGVSVAPQGQKGSLEAIWLRGASPKRVLVLINGVPTNNALEGQMDLSLIPPEIIERIEIVQGGLSLLYGSNAVGGVINIITKKGKSIDYFLNGSLAATSYLPEEYSVGGSTVPPQAAALFDGERTALSLAHNFGPFDFFLAGTFDWARNQYYYSDGAVTAQRDNAGFLGGSGFANLDIPWESGAFTLSALFAHHNLGVPSAITAPTPDASETDDRLQALAAYHEARFLTDILSLDVKLSLTQQHRLTDYPSYSYSEESNLTSFFAEISQKASVADFLSFVYGGNISFDRLTGNPYSEELRTSGSVFLSVPLSIGEVFRAQPTARLDMYSDFGIELTYGLGMSLRLTDIAALKLSLAKSFRAPNFLELYYPGFSNPALLPEHGWHADLGFAIDQEDLKIESALFIRYMTDEIINTAIAPENLAQSFYPGAEVQATIQFIKHFFIETAYTFIYSFNLADGRTLADDLRAPLVPVHELHVYLSYKTDDTAVCLGMNVQGERFNLYYTRTLPPYLVLNASFRQRLVSFLSLTLALENILNSQYQVVDGYPMPGIRLRWGVEIKL
jgi:vitamin B12 transporter